MTGDEVRRLQAHLEDAPGDDLEDLRRGRLYLGHRHYGSPQCRSAWSMAPEYRGEGQAAIESQVRASFDGFPYTLSSPSSLFSSHLFHALRRRHSDSNA